MPKDLPIVAQVSPQISDKVQGGDNAVLGALKAGYDSILMPAFTFHTMVYPKEGPKDNGVEYNNPPQNNEEAVFFHAQLPVSPRMGKAAETFRTFPETARSTHPILSFSGLNAQQSLQAQSLSHPYAPLATLHKQGGWVLLIDMDPSDNFSIHYALKKGGRTLFTRWSLTSAGVKVCPHFPGCENGFQIIQPHLKKYSQRHRLGEFSIMAVPLSAVVRVVKDALMKNPLALLCDQEHCLYCESIRARVGYASP